MLAIANTSRIEDSQWDGLVLGSLSQSSHADPDALERFLRKLPSDEALPQVLALARLPLDVLRTIGARLDSSTVDSPLWSRLLLPEPDHYDPAIQGNERLAWRSLGRMSSFVLDERFEKDMEDLLHQIGAYRRLSSRTLRRLNYLLFHPIENAQLYAPRSPDTTLPRLTPGITARIVTRIEPRTPTVEAYAASVEESSPGASGFLEVIIYDSGEGIAQHFARHRLVSTRQHRAFNLYSEDVSREWVQLKHAFERHASSRYFRQTVDQEPIEAAYAPGIGLAAMIAATKSLRAFFEVRCGRLRVYRWFGLNERVSHVSLLHPEIPPEEAPFTRGTIIRFHVPLDVE